MEEKRVKVMHPTNNRVADITMTDDMTIQDLLDSLIEARFLSDSGFGYQAVLKDGGEAVNMDLNKTLLENGGGNDSTIRLVSGTPAGC